MPPDHLNKHPLEDDHLDDADEDDEIRISWRGEKCHGDRRVACDLITSDDHPGQVHQGHLIRNNVNTHCTSPRDSSESCHIHCHAVLPFYRASLLSWQHRCRGSLPWTQAREWSDSGSSRDNYFCKQIKWSVPGLPTQLLPNVCPHLLISRAESRLCWRRSNFLGDCLCSLDNERMMWSQGLLPVELNWGSNKTFSVKLIINGDQKLKVIFSLCLRRSQTWGGCATRPGGPRPSDQPPRTCSRPSSWGWPRSRGEATCRSQGENCVFWSNHDMSGPLPTPRNCPRTQ